MRCLFPVILIVIISTNVMAQEKDKPVPSMEDKTIKEPVNLYDSLKFTESTSTNIKYGLYISAPAFVLIYGTSVWNWGTDSSFTYRSKSFKESDKSNGSADKYGHLYSSYALSRFSSFIFRTSSSSKLRANIEGVVFSELIMLGLEIGDGFSKYHYFDPYDVLLNNFGILAAFLLNYSPTLDRIFALKIEYVPTEKTIESFKKKNGSDADITTDYNGMKFILSTRLSGIPYISLTPLRYVNIDLGYYSRGAEQKDERFKTKNIFLGISINYTIAFGDILPTGYTSSTVQTMFNYVHLPWDYEARTWTVSKVSNQNYMR